MTGTRSAGSDTVVDPSSRIQAGQVTINGFGSRGVIGAPWGGYKHSGFGRTMSAESVLDYTQIKTVVVNA